ncbi:unnamed protein product [Ectocarpus sp. 8 AP-2014]
MKVTAAAAVCSLGMASAFVTPGAFRAPTASLSKASSKTPLSMSAVDGEVGVSLEAGGAVFDPLGLAELHSINPLVNPHPKWLQESEIKHCRICMLAFVGIWAAQSGFVFPGLGYEAVPWYDQFHEFASKNPGGLAQLMLFFAVAEGATYCGDFWSGGGEREAGDLGLYLKKPAKAAVEKLRLQELKNGRLAMISVAACASEHWIKGAVPFLEGQGY